MPAIPDDLWPDVLPIARLPRRVTDQLGKKSAFLWIGRDEIVAATVPDSANLGDAAFAAADGGALVDALKGGKVDRFPVEQIDSCQVAPRIPASGTAESVLTIRSGDRKKRIRLDLEVDSYAVDALRRLLGARLEVLPVRRAPGTWVLAGLIGAVLLLVLGVSRTLESGLGFFIATGLPVLGIWLFLFLRGRRAHQPRPRLKARATPIVRHPYRSRALGWALKIAGLVLAAAGYRAALWLTDRALGPSGDVLGRDVRGWLDLLGWMSIDGIARLSLALPLLLLVVPGMGLLYLGYLIGLPDPSRALKRPPEERILFLRSFGDDARHSFNEKGFVPGLLGMSSDVFEHIPPPFRYFFNLYPIRLIRLLFNRNLESTEEQLAQALKKVGPLVAIGRPNERFVTPGAARIYVDHEHWRDKVMELMTPARMVIVQPAATEGVWWEVEQAARTVDPRRLLICLAALREPDDRDAAKVRLGSLFNRRLPGFHPNHAFLWFDPDGSPRVEHLRTYSPFTWPFRGTSANLSFLADQFRPTESGAASPPVPSAKSLGRPPRRRSLARGFAAILFVLAQFGVAAGVSVALQAIRRPGPAQLVEAGTATVEDEGYSFPLNSAWKPIDPPLVLFAKSKAFQAGPDYRLEVISFGGGMRMDLKQVGGVEGYMRSVAAKMNERGPISGAKLDSTSEEPHGGRVWSHGRISGRLFLVKVEIDMWMLTTGEGDYIVQLSHPGGVGADDPLIQTVHKAFDSFEPKAKPPAAPSGIGRFPW